MARRLGVTRIHAKGDSNLVVQQVEGRWNINKDHLRKLCDQVHEEVRAFREFKIRHIPR
jgi:ribonuclease HI